MDERLRARYERELRHPRSSVVAAIDSLGLRPGMRMADVGCGPGAHLGLFARHLEPGGEVIGVDLDEDRLAVAAEFQADPIARGAVRLQPGDIARLPFDDGDLDLTWSSLVVHHSQQQLDLVGELARVTRPGGTVAVMEGDNDGSFPLLPWAPVLECKLRQALLRGQQERQMLMYTGRNLTRLFLEAGLVDVELRSFTDVDRAPLDSTLEREIREWFVNMFGDRARDYLAPVDWDAFAACFDPESDRYLLDKPWFFQSRTWFLVTGRVAG
jgi:ubiquinone/menaquinone biosynthesis C-methylase UbiE